MAPEFDTKEVEVTDGKVLLPGNLTIPARARGAVLFAHGSGSGRFSPRNQQVARTLNREGFATLLFDLLTEDESFDRANVFDIPLLASRLELATRWVEEQEEASRLPLGYFGASTGAGAALWAAADLGPKVSAVVSRGGRPDLAIQRLDKVHVPTLLIVGGNDELVIELNQEALRHLSNGRIEIVPGATHLFEEAGALEGVASLAAQWFSTHLGSRSKAA